MQKAVKCYNCQANPSEFTILICDHVICSDCIWNQNHSNNDEEEISIVLCTCGIKTCFNSQTNSVILDKSSIKNIRNSTKFTINSSALRSPNKPANSRIVQTETVHMDENNFLERIKPRNNQQKHNTTTGSFILHNASQMSVSSAENLSKELTNQIRFLEVQYNKSIEEAKKNFKKILKSIHQSFENLIKNIKYFCLDQIVEPEHYDFMNLSKILVKKYDKCIGKKIKSLNQNFFQLISTYKLEEGRDSRVTVLVSKEKDKDKENTNGFLSPNCKYYRQREKLLQQIEAIKEQKKQLKKNQKKGGRAEKMKIL